MRCEKCESPCRGLPEVRKELDQLAEAAGQALADLSAARKLFPRAGDPDWDQKLAAHDRARLAAEGRLFEVTCKARWVGLLGQELGGLCALCAEERILQTCTLCD